MLEEAYRWFMAERDRLTREGRSTHRSPLSRGLLALLSRRPR